LETDQIKFYADVHIARAVADGLGRHGIDFVMGVDVGLAEAEDRIHLAKAHREGRVLITQDEDFLSFHADGEPHSGIAYFPQGTRIGHMVSMLLLLYKVDTAAGMRGRVEFF
jgi:hypothetical protein